jgi:hypothetical protein
MFWSALTRTSHPAVFSNLQVTAIGEEHQRLMAARPDAPEVYERPCGYDGANPRSAIAGCRRTPAVTSSAGTIASV